MVIITAKTITARSATTKSTALIIQRVAGGITTFEADISIGSSGTLQTLGASLGASLGTSLGSRRNTTRTGPDPGILLFAITPPSDMSDTNESYESNDTNGVRTRLNDARGRAKDAGQETRRYSSIVSWAPPDGHRRKSDAPMPGASIDRLSRNRARGR